jgi:mycoredoxin-dependent peroxiredoxin
MPLEVGDRAPDFTLKDQNHQPVTLSSLHRDRNVLIVFYPFAFSRVCTGELTNLQDNFDAFNSADVTTVAISTDPVYALRAWAKQEGYQFTLLSDFWPHGEVAKAYGVFDERAGRANRGTFLIDTDGTVRFAEMGETGAPRNQIAWKEALAALPV